MSSRGRPPPGVPALCYHSVQGIPGQSGGWCTQGSRSAPASCYQEKRRAFRPGECPPRPKLPLHQQGLPRGESRLYQPPAAIISQWSPGCTGSVLPRVARPWAQRASATPTLLCVREELSPAPVRVRCSVKTEHHVGHAGLTEQGGHYARHSTDSSHLCNLE